MRLPNYLTKHLTEQDVWFLQTTRVEQRENARLFRAIARSVGKSLPLSAPSMLSMALYSLHPECESLSLPIPSHTFALVPGDMQSSGVQSHQQTSPIAYSSPNPTRHPESLTNTHKGRETGALPPGTRSFLLATATKATVSVPEVSQVLLLGMAVSFHPSTDKLEFIEVNKSRGLGSLRDTCVGFDTEEGEEEIN